MVNLLAHYRFASPRRLVLGGAEPWRALTVMKSGTIRSWKSMRCHSRFQKFKRAPCRLDSFGLLGGINLVACSEI